jgi:hydroxyethylthiazole kinase-like uncharacterized protein yjeF
MTSASAPPSPKSITPLNGPWPLHDTAASRAAEQAGPAGQAPQALMERAGLAVARLALALAPHAVRVDVWCGPGNNGGDGLVAARHLHSAGKRVRVVLLADPARLPVDAAAAWAKARAAGLHVLADMPDAGPPDLAIDALLGLGAKRAPEGRIAGAIATMNSFDAPLLAVDIPSGLHPDSGMPLGEAVVHATATLCLLTLKAGCFTGRGRDLAGATWWDDLGVAAGVPQAWLGGRAAPAGARAHAAHKGSFGDVAVVGGAAGMVGAAWLAARAASAAGAGRVYCCPLDAQTPLLDPLHAELMGRRDWWQSAPAVLATTTVACGCGGGDAVRAVLPALLSQVRRLVLDADALNAIAADTALQALLRARTGRGCETLLTPHPLEAARLLATTTAEVQSDRLRAAQSLAQAFEVAVLLKGSGSVIAAPGRVPVINPSGNAALATAGTGDVLAGWAAGLWAQAPDTPAADIARTAAWQHGRAADRWPGADRGAPLRAGSLIEVLARREFG